MQMRWTGVRHFITHVSLSVSSPNFCIPSRCVEFWNPDTCSNRVLLLRRRRDSLRRRWGSCFVREDRRSPTLIARPDPRWTRGVASLVQDCRASQSETEIKLFNTNCHLETASARSNCRISRMLGRERKENKIHRFNSLHLFLSGFVFSSKSCSFFHKVTRFNFVSSRNGKGK